MFNVKYGKTIKLFLLDADPDGRVICELSNWTGKAYRIPRGKVKDCADREELKSTAVYLARLNHLQPSQRFTLVKLKMLIADLYNIFPKKNFGTSQ